MLYTADNLPVLQGLATDSVDLIYLDPPFNSKRLYNLVLDGGREAKKAFRDTWTLDDAEVEWVRTLKRTHRRLSYAIRAVAGEPEQGYLMYMAIRLLEMKRVLKPTGSIYLHCDPTMSHYLKVVMDAIFGRRAFRNEIVWCYTGPSTRLMKHFPRKHDTILLYSADGEGVHNQVRVPYANKPRGGASNPWLGEDYGAWQERLAKRGKLVEDWWTGFPTGGQMGKERTGYQTQKPLKLLERIVYASSNEGDLVLDPFCGTGTTLIAAHRLGRRWIGIDRSPKAINVLRDRLRDDPVAPVRPGAVEYADDLPTDHDPGLPHYTTHKPALYEEQQGHCNGCQVHFPYRNLTVDHMFPRAKGGTDSVDNLQLLCSTCNSMKGQGSTRELKIKLLREEMAL